MILWAIDLQIILIKDDAMGHSTGSNLRHFLGVQFLRDNCATDAGMPHLTWSLVESSRLGTLSSFKMVWLLEDLALGGDSTDGLFKIN